MITLPKLSKTRTTNFITLLNFVLQLAFMCIVFTQFYDIWLFTILFPWTLFFPCNSIIHIVDALKK